MNTLLEYHCYIKFCTNCSILLVDNDIIHQQCINCGAPLNIKPSIINIEVESVIKRL